MLHKMANHANSFIYYVYLQIVTARCCIKVDSPLLRDFVAKIKVLMTIDVQNFKLPLSHKYKI